MGATESRIKKEPHAAPLFPPATDVPVVLALALHLVLAAEVSLQPGAAAPGDFVLITVLGVANAPAGRLGADELTFLPAAQGPGFEALTAVHVDQKPGLLTLEVGGQDDLGRAVRLEGQLEVSPPTFRHRDLTVSPRFMNLSKRDRQRSAKDQAAFDAAFDRDYEPLRFSDDFAWPRPMVLTAPFGDIRLINGKKKSQHFGLDLDGETGDPIYATNDGEVVLARDCFASGNTVLLHHGARLFTAYFHLSKFEVKTGDRVRKGQLLGLVGKTGRVTGPHLHWGAKIDGRWANAASLVSLRFQTLPDPATSPSGQPMSLGASPETP